MIWWKIKLEGGGSKSLPIINYNKYVTLLNEKRSDFCTYFTAYDDKCPSILKNKKANLSQFMTCVYKNFTEGSIDTYFQRGYQRTCLENTRGEESRKSNEKAM